MLKKNPTGIIDPLYLTISLQRTNDTMGMQSVNPAYKKFHGTNLISATITKKTARGEKKTMRQYYLGDISTNCNKWNLSGS